MTDGTQDSQNIQGTGGPQTGNIGHGHVCFMEKGYEAATMRDIAAAMHVVPGLCYRYFESKQMLYDTAIEQYVKDITHPMIERLKEKDDSLDGFLDKMEQLFIQTDGKEKVPSFFFIKKENHDLQMLMSVKLCETIEPYMEEKLRMMNEKGITRVKNIPITASYMLFGAVPVWRTMDCQRLRKRWASA